jgi:hypothetical protein
MYSPSPPCSGSRLFGFKIGNSNQERQEVTCGLPALRSSKLGSQHRNSLQLPVWIPLLDSIEHFPCDLTRTTAAAQQALPEALHGPICPLQRPEVSRNVIVGIGPRSTLLRLITCSLTGKLRICRIRFCIRVRLRCSGVRQVIATKLLTRRVVWISSWLGGIPIDWVSGVYPIKNG